MARRNQTPPPPFKTVEDAVYVLGNHRVEKRLAALREIGVNLDAYTHAALAVRVCASRERVCMGMIALNNADRLKAAFEEEETNPGYDFPTEVDA